MHISKKLLVVLVVIAAVTAILKSVVFSTPEKAEKIPPKSSKPVIMVSTFAIGEAASRVAGDNLDVRVVIPPGIDAHMFSPNPKEVAEISESAIFIYNGAGFEQWAETLTAALSEKTRIIDMSRHVDLIEEEEHSAEEAHDGHHHGNYDPHYWLDIDNMIKATLQIESEFSARFPESGARFHQNSEAYIGELKALKNDYNTALSECKNRLLVSNHDAFGYLAHSNRFKHVSVIGLSSDEQPSAKQIAQIVALVRQEGIKTVFFEEMIDDSVAHTIARETGAEAKALQPLENISQDELQSRQTYVSIMKDNLAKLKEAMECR